MYLAEVDDFRNVYEMITHHSVGVSAGYIFITAGENCQCQRPFHLNAKTIRDVIDVKRNSELLLNIHSSAKQ